MNKILKKLSIAALTVAACVSSSITVFAADSVQTGGVNVSSSTYTLDASNKKVDIDENSFVNLVPGEIVNYIIQVDNNAMSSYVRVKIVSDAFNTKMLVGVDSDWVYTNGYYYYKKVLEKDKSVELCKYLRVPEDVSKSFTVKAVAEGIQSANFSPDWTKDDPWNGVTIESNMPFSTIYTTERGFSVTTNDALKDCLDKSVILAKSGNLLPGDTITDTLTITTKEDDNLFISVKNDKAPEEAAKYKLVIKNGETEVYNGSLFDKKLAEAIELKNVVANKPVKLDFTFVLDSSLTNKSEWKDLGVAFDIKAVAVEKTPEPTKTPERIVFTGDNGTMILMMMISGITLISGIGLICYKAKSRKKGADSNVE